MMTADELKTFEQELGDLGFDYSKIRAIAKGNPTTEVVLAALASRERDTSKTDLFRLGMSLRKAGNPISQRELESMFRAFEKAGAGKLSKDSKGNWTQWKWFISMKEAAKALGAHSLAPAGDAPSKPSPTAPLGGQMAFVTEILSREDLCAEEQVKLLKAYLRIK